MSGNKFGNPKFDVNPWFSDSADEENLKKQIKSPEKRITELEQQVEELKELVGNAWLEGAEQGLFIDNDGRSLRYDEFYQNHSKTKKQLDKILRGE